MAPLAGDYRGSTRPRRPSRAEVTQASQTSVAARPSVLPVDRGAILGVRLAILPVVVDLVGQRVIVEKDAEARRGRERQVAADVPERLGDVPLAGDAAAWSGSSTKNGWYGSSALIRRLAVWCGTPRRADAGTRRSCAASLPAGSRLAPVGSSNLPRCDETRLRSRIAWRVTVRFAPQDAKGVREVSGEPPDASCFSAEAVRGNSILVGAFVLLGTVRPTEDVMCPRPWSEVRRIR